MTSTPRPSALGLMVLGFLTSEPMHAYRIQKLLRQTGKERVVNIRQRASVYQAIDRLERLGLLRVRSTDRAERHPERTIYEITDEGRAVMRNWLRRLLSEPDARFPDFAAAMSMSFLLEPDDVRRQLEHRASEIAAELGDVEAMLAQLGDIPRLFGLEEEYRRAVLRAQLDWTNSVVDDLRGGDLTWTQEWLRDVAARHGMDL